MKKRFVILLLALSLLPACRASDRLEQEALLPDNIQNEHTPEASTQAELETADENRPPFGAGPNLMGVFPAGIQVTDAEGDTSPSYVDIVGFEAQVDEETEFVTITLSLADVPDKVQIFRNPDETDMYYIIYVFADGRSVITGDPDYLMMALSGRSHSPEAIISRTVRRPLDEAFGLLRILEQIPAGEQGIGFMGQFELTANPDTGTVVLSGHIPGITTNAMFSYEAGYNPDGLDIPAPGQRQAIASDFTALAEPEEVSSSASDNRVAVYPGPLHYVGDVLTLEVTFPDGSPTSDSEIPAEVQINDGERIEVTAQNFGQVVVLPAVWNPGQEIGEHTVQIEIAGDLFETNVEILPADQRPEQEENAMWMSVETDCCIIHYLSYTAAARDIDEIVTHVEQAHADFTAFTGSVLDEPLRLYFIDRMWGNGAFGGGDELVVTYTDRNYGPQIDLDGLETLLHHEFTHAAGFDLADDGRPILYNEGLAVYVAGGHYKPEPLAQRGAALVELGYWNDINSPAFGHETGYLKGAVIVSYLVQTYGMETMLEFLAAGRDDLSAAADDVLSISITQLDREITAWLETQPPGDQVEDLRLTIELQELRRQYQDALARPPMMIFGRAEETFHRDPAMISVVIREATTPENVALELMIADGQRAIRAGEYERARTLVEGIRSVLEFGTFDDLLAADYLAISQAAADHGYDVYQVELDGDTARTVASDTPPVLQEVWFEQDDSGNWTIRT